MAERMISTINTISIVQLSSYDMPIRIYEEFMQKYPDHPAVKEIERLVDSLKLLREKNVGMNFKSKK